MIFRSFTNIDSALKYIRWFSAALVLTNAIICTCALYYAHQTADRMSKKVYVIAFDKLMEAVAVDRSEKLPFEIRHHITMFHQSFYDLEPDEQVNTRNITKSLYLADHSAKSEFDNLSESGYYNSIIAANISQQVQPPDSILLDISRKPWSFRYYGKLKIIRSTSQVTRSLITSGYIRTTSASDNNPHGFLIEHWQVLENKDLSIQKR